MALISPNNRNEYGFRNFKQAIIRLFACGISILTRLSPNRFLDVFCH